KQFSFFLLLLLFCCLIAHWISGLAASPSHSFQFASGHSLEKYKTDLLKVGSIVGCARSSDRLKAPHHRSP
ncbi:MAG: hypothetical protein OEV56_03290, partial [Dehalococcoidia bacterium]|nr:hypothetical protein [Dehalococcoidia bacterium]